ncbi:hypothetical protein Avbf_12288 [Armadillidium vulgare]|nr:hypothetical protein Avbf_12288 [Armadillidium vulgare]
MTHLHPDLLMLLKDVEYSGKNAVKKFRIKQEGLTGSPLTCHGRDGERVLSGILSLAGLACIKFSCNFTKVRTNGS